MNPESAIIRKKLQGIARCSTQEVRQVFSPLMQQGIATLPLCLAL